MIEYAPDKSVRWISASVERVFGWNSITWVSPAITRMLGWTQEQWVDQCPADFLDPDDEQSARAALTALGASEGRRVGS